MKTFFRVSVLLVVSSLVFSFILLFFRLNKSLNPGRNTPYLYPKILLKKPEAQEVTLLLAGDVMLGRSVMQEYLEIGDYTYPFKKVADRLKKAGLVFVNLENPIVANCPIHTGGFKFCSPPGSTEGLLYAGIDVVTLANNHTSNYGQNGLEETEAILTSRGISVTGLGKLAIVEREETLFGFLGFDKAQQSQPKLTAEEAKLIKDSDSKVDILVVGMHWGVEYQDKALPGVRNLAQDLVKNGVDVVVGHHPHWIQDYEAIEGKPVYYSLGNFVFDQMWSEETKKGLVVELTYKDGKLFSTNLHPTYISEIGQPSFSSAYLGE